MFLMIDTDKLKARAFDEILVQAAEDDPKKLREQVDYSVERYKEIEKLLIDNSLDRDCAAISRQINKERRLKEAN